MSATGRRHLHWKPNFSHSFRPAGVNGGKTIPFVSACYFVLIPFVSQICGQPAFARAVSHFALQSGQLKAFCDPHFCDGILLETVSDHQWLGFTIDAKARTATFNLPEKPWQIRSPASAGSWKLAASGYFSRASLIRQYGWPPEAIPGQLRRLKQLYVQAGFPAAALR